MEPILFDNGLITITVLKSNVAHTNDRSCASAQTDQTFLSKTFNFIWGLVSVFTGYAISDYHVICDAVRAVPGAIPNTSVICEESGRDDT